MTSPIPLAGSVSPSTSYMSSASRVIATKPVPSIIIDSGSKRAVHAPSAYHSVYVLPFSDITSLPVLTSSEPSHQVMFSARSSSTEPCVPKATISFTAWYVATQWWWPSCSSIISTYMLPFAAVCT